MTREVISVSETAELADVAMLLETNAIKRVPVINNGVLVGIISRANLVRALAATEPPAPTDADDEQAIRNRVLDELIRKRLLEELGSAVGKHLGRRRYREGSGGASLAL